MRRPFLFLVVLAAVMLITSCSQENPVTPVPESVGDDINVEALANALVSAAEWEIEATDYEPDPAVMDHHGGAPLLRHMSRELITGDIYHYSFELRVGGGPHNVIGIHRVVREERPRRPIRTEKTIMLLHGDVKNFVGMFLIGVNQPSTPDDFGMAVHLAENDVDVWGIDQAWTLAPEGLADYSFMADWGIQRQVDDARIALGVARLVRFITGNGHDRMIFSGYSSGVWTGYALLNHEAQLPAPRRHVKGFIPVDGAYVVDDAYFREMFCAWQEYYEWMIANGQYADYNLFLVLADLARTDPEGPSPIFEGFNNLQAALWFGIGQIFDPELSIHYLAGIWDENNMPVGLQYMEIDEWLEFMENAPPYEAVQFMADYCRISCGCGTPWDDHLADITVPIFNVAAIGGLGSYGIYTLSLLGSTDITELMVQLRPPDEILIDFGHIDIFAAYNAPELVWAPVYDWIAAHCE